MSLTLFLYHGTHAQFDEFSLEYSAEGAVFLTDNKAHAQKFGPVVLGVQLTVNRVLEVNGKTIPADHSLEDIEDVVQQGKEEGVDAVLIKGFRDAGMVSDTYLVLDPALCKIVRVPK